MNMVNNDKNIDILLVEDNPGDVRLTEEAFKEGKFNNNLSVVVDGLDAMSYLRKEGKYSDVARPDIILLDLNLPKKDGREVLKEIKSDQELKRIPVIVLTTSSAETDIHHTYGNYVNAYITKPVDLDQFIKVLGTIEEFWLNIVKLPER